MVASAARARRVPKPGLSSWSSGLGTMKLTDLISEGFISSWVSTSSSWVPGSMSLVSISKLHRLPERDRFIHWPPSIRPRAHWMLSSSSSTLPVARKYLPTLTPSSGEVMVMTGGRLMSKTVM